MTPDEFVAAIESVVYKSAVNATMAGLRDGPPVGIVRLDRLRFISGSRR